MGRLRRGAVGFGAAIAAALAGGVGSPSVAAAGGGTPGDDVSERASISATGRYVVFVSRADNLDPTPPDAFEDVFIRDLQTRTTRRVSVSAAGLPGNDNSSDPSVSADGGYVTFTSWARNLIPGDTTPTSGIFRKDLHTGAVVRVNVSADGEPGFADASQPRMSSDGQRVVFSSTASNLVPGDDAESLDVFVRNLAAGTTKRISRLSTNRWDVDALGLSPNGRVAGWVESL